MHSFLGLSTLIAFFVALVVAGDFEIHPKSAFNKRHARTRVVRELDSTKRLANEVAVLGARDLEKRFEGVRITYYDAGLGACGRTNTNSDFIVALNAIQFGSGGHCFETITIIANGKTATAQITDECMGCPYGGLDFSRGLFNYFASESAGILTGSWYFGATPTTPTTTTTHIPTTSHTSPTPITTTSTTIHTPSSSSSVLLVSSFSSTSSAADPLRSSSPNATTSLSVLEQMNLVFVNFGAIVVVGGRKLD